MKNFVLGFIAAALLFAGHSAIADDDGLPPLEETMKDIEALKATLRNCNTEAAAQQLLVELNAVTSRLLMSNDPTTKVLGSDLMMQHYEAQLGAASSEVAAKHFKAQMEKSARLAASYGKEMERPEQGKGR